MANIKVTLERKVANAMKQGLDYFLQFVNGLPTDEEKKEAVALAFPKVDAKEKVNDPEKEKEKVWNELDYFTVEIGKKQAATDAAALPYFNQLSDTEKANIHAFITSRVSGIGTVQKVRYCKEVPYILTLKCEHHNKMNYQVVVFNARLNEKRAVQGLVTDVYPTYETDYYSGNPDLQAQAKKNRNKHHKNGLKAALELARLYKALDEKKPEEQTEKQA